MDKDFKNNLSKFEIELKRKIKKIIKYLIIIIILLK